MLVLKDLTFVLLLSIHNNQAALITSSGLVVPACSHYELKRLYKVAMQLHSRSSHDAV